jgi:hypothetical protein
MLDAIKSKSKTLALRASLTLNAAVVVLLLVSCLAAKTGHFHADIQIDPVTIGGGTSEHQALNAGLQKLASAVPASAVMPVAVRAKTPPLPQEKPEAQ